MLLGNYTQLTKTPILYLGGDSVSGLAGLFSNFNNPGNSRGRFYGETLTVGTADRFGLPSAYNRDYSWILPQKDGGLGTTIGVVGTGIVSNGNLAGGKNAAATIDGLGEIIDASCGLILSAVATLAGIGGLTADILGKLEASADLAGEGDMSGSLGALAGAVADIIGAGTMAGSPNAKAFMSSDIYVNSGTATTKELASEVWNSVASEFNSSGTMGNKLNAAGTAGDPWTADLSSYDTDGTAGKKLKDSLSEDNFLALK
jgi:hypothetical protein